ncbi:tRNA uracil-5--methyltransferase-like A [Hondaea fermentalgiana]|uniref:tRNA uracil-5--methyltransferase-like A n=1 Tax=Hondaea fermentalgiana TaxID=2315210 RepID=A0A2R5G8Z0_9STRA|nr:tRNA uracil-5--methyltransferase-like A [Hondaea fermentalgiana]|eukprot:GBG27522.1 tRNA uracil-5--methyltransferase-like A [Hondaea fermentalgiana]
MQLDVEQEREKNARPEKMAKRRKRKAARDPSMQYLADPAGAPMCRAARAFFTKTCGLPRFEVVLGRKGGWRVVAKLAVRGTPPVFGMFKPGTHDIAELLHSDAQHEAINACAKLLHKAVLHAGVQGYDGKNAGGLSYVALNADTMANRAQVVCVFNHEKVDTSLRGQMANVLAYMHAHGGKKLLHSVWVHCNPAGRHDNNIFAHEGAWERLEGDKFIEERLEPLEGAVPYALPILRFPPMVFRQANPEAFAGIIAEARKWMQPDGSSKLPVTVELYGGVGTIGLHMLDLVRSISISDANPHNKACFESTVEGLETPALRAKVRAYDPRDAVQVAQSGALSNAEVVIVDPPRKGLDKDVVYAFSRARRLRRIVYISCGFKALQRDTVALQRNGFKLDFAKGHVLFPGADHIETLAVFTRDARAQ